jgi:hypothetical protein
MKTDTNTDERHSSWGARVVFALMLLLLYPLSVGPVAWLTAHGYLPGFVVYVYMPLQGLYMALPAPIREAFDAYVQWWGS